MHLDRQALAPQGSDNRNLSRLQVYLGSHNNLSSLNSNPDLARLVEVSGQTRQPRHPLSLLAALQTRLSQHKPTRSEEHLQGLGRKIKLKPARLASLRLVLSAPPPLGSEQELPAPEHLAVQVELLAIQVTLVVCLELSQLSAQPLQRPLRLLLRGAFSVHRNQRLGCLDLRQQRLLLRDREPLLRRTLQLKSVTRP